MKPKLYTIVFVSFDLLSLVLQAIGGALAATAKPGHSQNGTHIMIGGLICQVLSMVLFIIVWGDFALRTRRAKFSGALSRTAPPLYADLRSTRTFTYFQWSKSELRHCHEHLLMIWKVSSSPRFSSLSDASTESPSSGAGSIVTSRTTKPRS